MKEVVSKLFITRRIDARLLTKLKMPTTKNSAQSIIGHLRKYFILISLGSVVLVGAFVYVAMKVGHSPEYVYQDKSGTKVVLQETQCEYSVEILKSMAEKFGKTREQVKALALYGDDWKKDGCWIKLETTNEVAVSTEPGKIDTVLDLGQFTQTGVSKVETSQNEPKGTTSFFSKGVDPINQDVFAFVPKLPETDLGASYTFVHKFSCADTQGYSKLVSRLQSNGHNPYDWKVGALELGAMVGGRWERTLVKPLCYQSDPSNRQIVFLMDSGIKAISYDELSVEPYKAAKVN